MAPSDHPENPKFGSPTLLGDILRKIVDKAPGPAAGSGPAVGSLRVYEVWDKIAGAQLAHIARPQSYHNGRLYVGTPNSSWVTELTYRREDLRNRLNQELGQEAVREIIFRLASK
jgi:predicted nucleic acid-binding Zn ribbon protein